MSFPQHLLAIPTSTTPAPTLAEELAAHQSQLSELVDHFSKDGYTLAVAEESDETAPLSDREMMFLSQETLLRFLRATKTGVAPTIDRLERCIVWRRSLRLDDVDMLDKETEVESRMGKHFVLGFTDAGQPVMYLFPSRNSLPLEERNIKHSVFMIERAQDLMCGSVTNLVLLLNLSGKRKGPPTSISAARDGLYAIGEYYPELLGRAIITDMPWYVRAFVTIMWPFVDSHTKAKVLVCPGDEAVRHAVGADILLTDCGGSLEWAYDFDSYWPTFMELCRERREDQLRRWTLLGEPAVGREERLFKVAPEGEIQRP